MLLHSENNSQPYVENVRAPALLFTTAVFPRVNFPDFTAVEQV